MHQITFAPTFLAWQQAARGALNRGWEPATVHWQELGDEQPGLSLFEEADESAPAKPSNFRVPKDFLALARRVSCNCDAERWALLYRVLWRLTHGEPHLLAVTVDPDIHRLAALDKAVRHDVHKMRAFVRFRAVPQPDAEPWYVAWFEPAHHIVEANAVFFRDRFTGMHWSILTPERCVHWDGGAHVHKGVPRSAAPDDDAVEDLWRQYYAHIFNPARVKIQAMQSEMPKKYWKNLPEAELIPVLIRDAPKRVETMMAKSEKQAATSADGHHLAEPPPTREIATLRAAAATCTACPLYQSATQTVFGEGALDAEVVFVGEQPGDSEDVAGKPFLGPAGKLLDQALAEAGIDRAAVYVTNAVKHFKWEPRGKRRLHKTPSSRDIASCRPWLEAELASLRPRVLVCLGSTAAHSVVGPQIRVLKDRGQVMETPFCASTIVTVHPSSLLRAPDEAARAAAYQLFIDDLRVIARLIRGR